MAALTFDGRPFPSDCVPIGTSSACAGRELRFSTITYPTFWSNFTKNSADMCGTPFSLPDRASAALDCDEADIVGSLRFAVAVGDDVLA